MSSGPRQFTIEEANGLVPRLTLEFGRLARLREEIASLARKLGGPDIAVEFLERRRTPITSEVAAAERLRQLADDVSRTLARIQELGCLVKDVERGLIDFHGELEGRRVLLCWQFGEATVTHVHGLDEGFANRRPLIVEEDSAEGPPERWMN